MDNKKGPKRTTTPTFDKEVADYIKLNPSVEMKQIKKMFSITEKILMRIRIEHNLYHGYTRHMTNDDKRNMLIFMQENPLITYQEMMDMFDYTYKQLQKIRRQDKSLPNLMQVTKQKMNNSHMRPEMELEIISYMRDNPLCDHNDLSQKFGCSVRQIERLRYSNGFPSIKRRPATTHQSILRLEGKRYCPKCNTVKLVDEFPPYRQSCCLSCERIRSNQRDGIGDLEKFIKAKIRNTNLRKNLGNSLELDDVINLYKTQNGKCYYSGRELMLEKHNPQSLSIDRLDSNIGYHKENIVLCCSMVNYMKQEYDINLFLEFCNEISIKHPRSNLEDFPV